jgi:hypothetical protein
MRTPWRTLGLLLLVALGLGAFVYFYEMEGESGRLDAEERSKRLFSGIEAEDIDWIALVTTDGVEARLEQAEGAWRLVEPLPHPADAAVGRMAEALAGITHEATFDDPQPDAEYGLDEASARIVRFGVDDAEHTLRLGRDTPVGPNVYAKADATASVYTVASYRKSAFERTLTDLRDKQILAFDQAAIREVEARWPDGRVVVERATRKSEGGDGEPIEGETWQMRVPVAASGDDAAVDRLLSTLAFLRAEDFVDVPSEADRSLLDPPDYAVSLRSADAEAPPITLAIGRVDAQNQRPVQAGGGPIVLIAADRIEDFPRETVAYRDRTLVRVDTAAAAQLDFFFQSRSGDPSAIHAARTDDGWSSTPEPFAEGKLAGIVAELSDLEAVDILAESMGEAELEGVGLSPPNTILTVLGATPEAEPEEGELPPEPPILAEVHFGKVTAEGVVARNAKRDTIYRLGIEIAENLPVSLEAFHNRFRAQPEEAQPPLPPAGNRGDLIDPGEESP